MSRSPVALAVVLSALALAPAALAAGRPPSASQGGGGVLSLDGAVRYVALPASGGGTAVVARSAATRETLRRQVVAGRFGVPVAAYGTGTGLSPDGELLVLGTIHTQDPGVVVQRTTLLALDTSLKAPPRRYELPGNFAVDAVSPGARWLYLIERYGTDDPWHYRVRYLDLRSGRLLPQVVVDKAEPNEQMSGWPVARATTGGGRHVFTLYMRSSGRSFVHALDTVTHTARCLDLPESISSNLVNRLQFHGPADGRLTLAAGDQPAVAWIDLPHLQLQAGTP